MLNYAIQEQIFENSSCKIVRAERRRDAQSVAIKMIPIPNTEQIKPDLIHEIDSWINFSHPNIITSLEHFIYENQLCIVMEYFQGENLQNFIDRKKEQNASIDEKTILLILAQLISALIHCEENKFLFHDLRPENIIIDQNNLVKILDFGIFNDIQSYVWNLGGIIYELMTFSNIYCNPNLTDCIQAFFSTGILPMASQYSKDLKNILLSLFDKQQYYLHPLNNIQKLPFIPRVGTELPPSQYNYLGLKYKDGLGVEKDLKKSMNYFKIFSRWR